MRPCSPTDCSPGESSAASAKDAKSRNSPRIAIAYFRIGRWPCWLNEHDRRDGRNGLPRHSRIISGRRWSGRRLPAKRMSAHHFPIPGTDETLIVPTGTLERPSGKSLARPIGLFPQFRTPPNGHFGTKSSRRIGRALPWGVNLTSSPRGCKQWKGWKIIRYAPGADAARSLLQSSVAIEREAVTLAVELLRQKLGIAAQPNANDASRN